MLVLTFIPALLAAVLLPGTVGAGVYDDLAAGEARVPARVTELPPVPELDWAAPPVTAPAPSDLRDAMAEEDACSSALKRLRELNAKALDLKARYWAAKLKDPSFSLASLTRNPGSELQDRAARRGFYDLLAGYHAGGRAPLLTAGERQRLEAFMKRENEVLGRCGSR